MSRFLPAATSKMSRILIVDQEIRVHEALTSVLEPMGHEVSAYRSAALALPHVKKSQPEVIIAEAENGGLEMIEKLRTAERDACFLLTCTLPRKETALQALRAGAFGLFSKPLNVKDFVTSINRALTVPEVAESVTAEETQGHEQPLCLVGQSNKAKSLRKQCEAIVASKGRTPVLIQGASGVGKRELIRHLHHRICRSGAPFVEVPCEELSTSELRERLVTADGSAGPAFLEAKGGTLVFRRVDLLSEDLQEALAPFIKPAAKETLILATSDTDLDEALAAGEFSVKFYFQISAKVVEAPALHNRGEDIPDMVDAILTSSPLVPANARHTEFTGGAIEHLRTHDWDGSLRLLERTVAAAAERANGRPVDEKHLADTLRRLGR